MTEFHRPCLLDLSRHDRSQFSCLEPSFTEWLQRYSGQSRRGNTAATWVIADGTERIVAYATLSMFAIDRSKAPGKLGKAAPDPVPALLIGRLAVDQSVAGLGIGTALVKHILATALELNQQAACRAVVVTALNDAARAWWHRLGFTPFAPDDPSSFDLYLLTDDVAATRDSI